MATIEEDIAELEAYLTILKQARNDVILAGGIKRFEKGNGIVTYWTRDDFNTEIRQTESKIIILKRGIY